MSSIFVLSSVTKRVKSIKFSNCRDFLSPSQPQHNNHVISRSFRLLTERCNKLSFAGVHSSKSQWSLERNKQFVINTRERFQITESTCLHGLLGPVFTRGITSSVCCLSANEERDPRNNIDKTLRVKLKAQRLDTILKAGLGLSRNKIEKALYEDRVRVNGRRPQKKSQDVYEGDELDVVRGLNQLNPENFIDVSRVEIVELKGGGVDNEGSDSDSDDDETSIEAVLRRSKVLTIKNYKTPWKTSSKE